MFLDFRPFLREKDYIVSIHIFRVKHGLKGILAIQKRVEHHPRIAHTHTHIVDKSRVYQIQVGSKQMLW